jgi:iron only hydrogenase large subunit-like protein
VSAIQINGGQAKIINDLCIQCGTCVRECPQKAKTITSDLNQAELLLNSGKRVIASVAPSFPAVFPDSLALRLPSALRALGFHTICETAEGAKYITSESFRPENVKNVCTACPAVVSYVEKHNSQYLDTLIPVVSPMIAHGRLLKSLFPEALVIFIGPCAAKKVEITRPENLGAVDLALTFQELLEWFKNQDISLEESPESNFENFFEIGEARLFPIQSGMLKTGGILSDGIDKDILHLSGAESVKALFSGQFKFPGKIVEPLFCEGGCIGGPSLISQSSIFERRENIIKFAHSLKNNPKTQQIVINSLATFQSAELPKEEITENQIQKVFVKTGKAQPIFQLNCGACGYNSCYENAVAVIRGMAEPEMCIPFMRRLAQQRTDRIIETIPNGIVVVDSDLSIIRMNPAFQKMFLCDNGLLGRKISYLVNPEGFELMQNGSAEDFSAIRTKYGIRYHEILYALREDNQFVGIYSDLSNLKFDSNQMEVIKSQTLAHAKQFLDHQVRFAQEMAHYLGTSTAKSEEIAKRLIALFEVEEGNE